MPHAQAALVLGAQVKANGQPSVMLADCIAAAEDLYRVVGEQVLGAHAVAQQDSHMARALYAARRAGLDATGYSADRRPYPRVIVRLKAREVLARVKVVADAVTGAQPRFLGPQIPIGGDGRRSWGPEKPTAR